MELQLCLARLCNGCDPYTGILLWVTVSLTELMAITNGIRTNVIVVRRHEAAIMKTRTRMACVEDRIMTLMFSEI